MTEANEIVLALNQSAEPGHCGSCHFFRRDPDMNEWVQNGRCKFRLPPNRVVQRQEWDPETMPLDTVKDTNSCDLYRPSGKTYVVSRRIKP